VLAGISRHLITLDDADRACDLVCRMLPEALDADWGSCWLVDGDGTLRQSARWRRDEQAWRSLPPLDHELARESIVAWCSAHARAATIGRTEIDPRESDRSRTLRHRMNVGSVACAPLFRQGRCIGVMVVARTHDRRDFGDAAAGVLAAVTDQLSMALDRVALSLKLHHQAHHDSLTGLPNRRSLEQALEHALATADGSSDRFAVLFLDLDGFKHVNDTLGHAMGARLLVRVAERFGRCLREGDLLARLGGDEFAVIVRERQPDEARAVAASSLSGCRPCAMPGCGSPSTTSAPATRH